MFAKAVQFMGPSISYSMLRLPGWHTARKGAYESVFALPRSYCLKCNHIKSHHAHATGR